MKAQAKTNFAGIDFPSMFDNDLFSMRRSGTGGNAGNPYDPESLLTGAEMAQGLDYVNSRRNWPDYETYLAACSGEMSKEEILRVAPRAFLKPALHVDLLRPAA